MKSSNLGIVRAECEQAIYIQEAVNTAATADVNYAIYRNACDKRSIHSRAHSPRASRALLRLLKLVESLDAQITSQGFLEADDCVKYKAIFTSYDRDRIHGELAAIATEFARREEGEGGSVRAAAADNGERESDALRQDLKAAMCDTEGQTLNRPTAAGWWWHRSHDTLSWTPTLVTAVCREGNYAWDQRTQSVQYLGEGGEWAGPWLPTAKLCDPRPEAPDVR